LFGMVIINYRPGCHITILCMMMSLLGTSLWMLSSEILPTGLLSYSLPWQTSTNKFVTFFVFLFIKQGSKKIPPTISFYLCRFVEPGHVKCNLIHKLFCI
jgi:TorA maturation chaperone TorD